MAAYTVSDKSAVRVVAHTVSLLYVYFADDYLMNLKVCSKTTKYRDFPTLKKCTVILPIFLRGFLTALVIIVIAVMR